MALPVWLYPLYTSTMYNIAGALRKGKWGSSGKHFSDDLMYIPILKGMEGKEVSKVLRAVGGTAQPASMTAINVLNEVGSDLVKAGIKDIESLKKYLIKARSAASTTAGVAKTIDSKVRNTSVLTDTLPFATGSIGGAAIGVASSDKKEKGAAVGAVTGGILGLLGGHGIGRAIKSNAAKETIETIKYIGSKEKDISEGLTGMINAIERYQARGAGKAVGKGQKALQKVQNSPLWRG